MDERKKLSVMIEHWIEHNDEHMEEYKKWANKAEELGLKSVRKEIEEAIGSLSQSNRHLKRALKEAA
jgi:hypothetical protein